MTLISSKSNSAVKQIRALRHRKEREATGLFLAEGIRIVAEALEVEAPVERLVVAPELLSSEFAHGLIEMARRSGTPVMQVSAEVFRSIALKENPQGLAATIRQRWARLEDIDPGHGLCWIALDSVQDPGNLGTILRTADAVGAAGIMLVGASTDPYDPATLRASMGAVFSQQLVRTNTRSLDRWRRAKGVHLAGTSDAASTDYQTIRYRRPLLLFMGSEREGLSAEQQAMCDDLARIPMVGRSDSLNLAVATGVMLYEIFNQQRHQ